MWTAAPTATDNTTQDTKKARGRGKSTQETQNINPTDPVATLAEWSKTPS